MNNVVKKYKLSAMKYQVDNVVGHFIKSICEMVLPQHLHNFLNIVRLQLARVN